MHSRRRWATGAASALVTVAVLLGFTAARANVDINITSSNGCAWAGGSAISGNSGSGQTTDWLSDWLYSVGVRMDAVGGTTGLGNRESMCTSPLERIVVSAATPMHGIRSLPQEFPVHS